MPWLLTLAVFWIYPLVFSLVLSFSDYDVFHPELFSFVGFENYARLIKDSGFRQALFNTFIFVVGTTPVTTVLALILALMINSVRRGNQVFRSVFFLPSIVSIVVTASIFKSIYSPMGLLNRVIELFGLTGHGWLVEKSFAMPAIMMMNIWAYTGYYMVLYLAALTAVPKQLYEAAEVDGATILVYYFATNSLYDNICSSYKYDKKLAGISRSIYPYPWRSSRYNKHPGSSSL